MDQSSSPEANGPNHAPHQTQLLLSHPTYLETVFHVHQFSNATENEPDTPPQSMIPGTLDAPHHPVAFDPVKGLEHFSFTPHSDYLGELHPDGTNHPFSYSDVRLADLEQTTGTPLTYAPALGAPLHFIDPKRAPKPRRRRGQVTKFKPGYGEWEPVQVLHAYNALSGTPSSLEMAHTEAGLIERPLCDEILLDHLLRVRTLERWWDVKNAQRERKTASSSSSLDAKLCWVARDEMERTMVESREN
ncbi:MAG: hypothetical protein LQ348_005646 [Seirophora lacunosa]|nr:MAG: hypothetical protein LQ348_005646 [Seirophora lacunosa]